MVLGIGGDGGLPVARYAVLKGDSYVSYFSNERYESGNSG